jgi:hypothetical protein
MSFLTSDTGYSRIHKVTVTLTAHEFSIMKYRLSGNLPLGSKVKSTIQIGREIYPREVQ